MNDSEFQQPNTGPIELPTYPPPPPQLIQHLAQKNYSANSLLQSFGSNSSSTFHSPSRLQATIPSIPNTPLKGAGLELSQSPHTPTTLAASHLQPIDPVLAMYSQIQQMQGQMSLLSQLALVNGVAATNAANNQANQNNNNNNNNSLGRDPMLAFALGEKLGALGKSEELSKDNLTSLNSSLDENKKNLSELQVQSEILRNSISSQSKQNERTGERVDKILSDLGKLSRDIAELTKTQQYESELRKNSNESTTKEVQGITIRLSETRDELSKQVIQQQSLNVELSRERQTRIEDQKEQKQSITSLKQEISGLLTKVENLQLQWKHHSENSQQQNKRMERELREARETIQTDLNNLETRLHNMTNSQQQQSQNQLQSLRMELFAEMRRTQYGNEVSGIIPFLLQLALPFLSFETVLSIVQSIRAMQGPFIEKFVKKIWLLVLFGDLAARYTQHKHPLLYGMIVPNIQLSPQKQLVLKFVRVLFEMLMISQLLVSFGTYIRAKYFGAKEKLNEASTKLNNAKSNVSHRIKSMSNIFSNKKAIATTTSAAVLVGIIGGLAAWKAQGNEFSNLQNVISKSAGKFRKQIDLNQLKTMISEIDFSSLQSSFR